MRAAAQLGHRRRGRRSSTSSSRPRRVCSTQNHTATSPPGDLDYGHAGVNCVPCARKVPMMMTIHIIIVIDASFNLHSTTYCSSNLQASACMLLRQAHVQASGSSSMIAAVPTSSCCCCCLRRCETDDVATRSCAERRPTIKGRGRRAYAH